MCVYVTDCDVSVCVCVCVCVTMSACYPCVVRLGQVMWWRSAPTGRGESCGHKLLNPDGGVALATEIQTLDG